jgi:hypothetical protein
MNTLLIYSLLNGFGLFLDIVGVTLIFRYGLSPLMYDQTSDIIYVGSPPLEIIKRAKKHKRIATIGLILCIVGFILQLSATLVNHFKKG